jgi:hypothetical protein
MKETMVFSFSFPFKGKVGMGMGFYRHRVVSETHPHPPSQGAYWLVSRHCSAGVRHCLTNSLLPPLKGRESQTESSLKLSTSE